LSQCASASLVTRWRAGCELAATVLTERYQARLIALVASRLGRRYRSAIAAEDVVQSALGSFFRVASVNDGPDRWKLRLEDSVSAWNLLAVFVRRKLARSLDRVTAAKRGGGMDGRSIQDGLNEEWFVDDSSEIAVGGLLEDLRDALSPSQLQLLDRLLAQRTQGEIAVELGVDERTVRRHVDGLRAVARTWFEPEPMPKNVRADPRSLSVDLPKVEYNQFVLGKMIGRGGPGRCIALHCSRTVGSWLSSFSIDAFG
jgi:eukaryotic-like serine/threonine-protein kinase